LREKRGEEEKWTRVGNRESRAKSKEQKSRIESRAEGREQRYSYASSNEYRELRVLSTRKKRRERKEGRKDGKGKRYGIVAWATCVPVNEIWVLQSGEVER
jgi:hypothetical protein